MANPPIGNNALEGCIGMCQIEFNSIDMGMTMGGVEIERIRDIVDIKYDQQGTQPQDKVFSGMAWKVRTPLAEATIARLEQLLPDLTVSAGGSVKFGQQLFISCKDNFSYKLKVRRCDSDGIVSTDPYMIINYYKAFPDLTAPFTYTVDGQRVVEIEWYIFKDSTNNCFGYMGYNSSLGIAA